MDAEETHEPTAMRTLDAGALKALSHPMRVEIYDIIGQYGPQTASSLAARLGESSGITSYHLRALAQHDLIREVTGRGTARERWWGRPVGRISLGGPGAHDTPAARTASRIVTSELYERRNAQLREFLAREEEEPAGWENTAMLATATARLTADQLRLLGEQISALVTEAVETHRDQDGPDVRRIALRVDLFPLPDQHLPEKEA